MGLIDADNLDVFFCDTIEDCNEMIANEPTVDAVPVVRCGECKHHLYQYTLDSGELYGLCSIHDTADLSGNSFCSYGERKTNE